MKRDFTLNIYFIADTHFGDDNIRRYENRPYDNVIEMDNSLIENWNKTVSDCDETYILGNFIGIIFFAILELARQYYFEISRICQKNRIDKSGFYVFMTGNTWCFFVCMEVFSFLPMLLHLYIYLFRLHIAFYELSGCKSCAFFKCSGKVRK